MVIGMTASGHTRHVLQTSLADIPAERVSAESGRRNDVNLHSSLAATDLGNSSETRSRLTASGCTRRSR
jgi:hypothetical protein